MDASSINMWLANFFIPNLPNPKQLSIYCVDSVDAPIYLDILKLVKNQVFIFTPLTKLQKTPFAGGRRYSLFDSMKKAWCKNVRLFSQKNPNTGNEAKLLWCL